MGPNIRQRLASLPNFPAHILLVDDDPTIHKIFGRMLPTGRFRVSNAYSADEAMQLLHTTRPHLVILDIMMPNVSGLAVCAYMKTQEALRDVPVLVLSARDSQDARLEGFEHGADDYIGKPFHVSHLVRKIEHLLEGHD